MPRILGRYLEAVLLSPDVFDLLEAYMPSDIGVIVNNFIRRLEQLEIPPEHDRGPLVTRNKTEFIPSCLIRSAASQVSAELQRHYEQGTGELINKKPTLPNHF
ncbi:hypothetical protein BGW38_000022 [Lunasporangiospora selenospora]|uniref:Uncharacterized protein n=1 Tax=Lunasporangiospora selenospora TaxID=979761 RepID=A0A9P6G3P1_9FUNG|nr:hypothetical protein BGW38_000022 [Lunasporangiospora selenospora]